LDGQPVVVIEADPRRERQKGADAHNMRRPHCRSLT
jgi:hypothetical protein